MNKKNKKKDIILFGDKIQYESVTSVEREEILESLSKHNYIESMNLVKKMIKFNIEYIMENTQEIKEEKTNKKKDSNDNKDGEITVMPKNLFNGQIYNLMNCLLLTWINRSDKYEDYDYCLSSNGILPP